MASSKQPCSHPQHPAPSLRSRSHPVCTNPGSTSSSSDSGGSLAGRLASMWANVDINGFYPDGPGLPFGGFGKVDPNQGIINQQTNNTWSQLKYQALEVTLTKNPSKGFQIIAGL